MTLGQRIEQRRKEKGFSQAELARRAQMPQSTLNTLINSDARWSPHLSRIARQLVTTIDYLTGDVDDPDLNAAPPLPDPTHDLVMLPVALPTAAALTRMFLGLLQPFELECEDVLSRTLARQLPKALRQLQGRLTETPSVDLELEDAEAPASDPRAPRQATRT